MQAFWCVWLTGSVLHLIRLIRNSMIILLKQACMQEFWGRAQPIVVSMWHTAYIVVIILEMNIAYGIGNCAHK